MQITDVCSFEVRGPWTANLPPGQPPGTAARSCISRVQPASACETPIARAAAHSAIYVEILTDSDISGLFGQSRRRR